jgi:hypothetical protein
VTYQCNAPISTWPVFVNACFGYWIIINHLRNNNGLVSLCVTYQCKAPICTWPVFVRACFDLVLTWHYLINDNFIRKITSALNDVILC